MSVQFTWVQYLLMVSFPFLFVYQNFTVSLRILKSINIYIYATNN